MKYGLFKPVKLSNSPYFTATSILIPWGRRKTDHSEGQATQVIRFPPTLGINMCEGVVELCRQTMFFWKYAPNARIVPIVLSAPAASSPNREMP